MRNPIQITILTLAALCFSLNSHAEQKLPVTKAPKGAAVYIISPTNGATVKSPVTVVFGLKNMGIAPAGVNSPETGHHHLVIDAPLPPEGQPIPNNDKYKHYGKGQTETSLQLKPGKHTLQLVLGDHLHIPLKPMVKSDKITITVQ